MSKTGRHHSSPTAADGSSGEARNKGYVFRGPKGVSVQDQSHTSIGAASAMAW